MDSKIADLAGPGIGDYAELESVLPDGYQSALTPRQTMEALFEVKAYVEEQLCRELGLMMVQVPLIVDAESGVNDYLDRDGSRARSSSTSATITISTRSMHRWCRRRRNGSESPWASSHWSRARASVPT